MWKDSFLKYLLFERNYSEKTIISYGTDLDEFEEYFKGVDEELDFTKVDADLIRGWVLSLMEEGCAETTVNRKLSSLRSFYRYLLRQKAVAVDPAAKVVGPKKKKPLPVFLRDEDMDSLLEDNGFAQTFEGVRDRTMLEVFYSTGIRRAELIALKDADIDFSSSVIKVTGKRNKQRLIPFGTRLKEVLESYLAERNRFYAGECEAFFYPKARDTFVSIVCKLYCEAIPVEGGDPKEEKPTCAEAYFRNHDAKSSCRTGSCERVAGT